MPIRNKAILVIALLALGISSSRLNAAGEIEMEKLFRTDFAGFKPPTAEVIKQDAVSRTISEATFDDVWKAVLVVAMQRNVLVSVSKETGVVIGMEIPLGSGILVSGFPVAIVVEAKGPREIIVYCNWPEEFYKLTDTTGVKFSVKSFSKERLSKSFLDRVVNQALIKYRWQYLQQKSAE